MAASYKSFQEIKDQEMEGRDFRIRTQLRNSPILVMAPHGGRIEPGTTEMAEAIAGTDFSLYSFEGLKPEGNHVFHIESHLYDEPQALQAVHKAEIVVTIHGQIDQEDEFVMVGGLHTPLCLEIKNQLEAAGFQTRPPTKGLSGTDPMNICNRGSSRRGVQLEVSRKVRDLLRAHPDQLRIFADAVRRAIKRNRSRGFIINDITR
jgi:phage replication-related protein YjqB (UPF0714/DUF867 family)